MASGGEGAVATEALMEEEDSEGSEATEVAAGAELADGSDEWDGSEDSGWFADPDVEGQERYFDGTEWTPETRPIESDAPVHHLPDHAGELQRALAAATEDIDDVEDRLGNLFDRAEQRGERGGRARKQVADQGRAAAVSAPVPAEAQTGAQADSDDEEVENWLDDSDELDADGDDALAELDEALASEEPEKVKRHFFRRS